MHYLVRFGQIIKNIFIGGTSTVAGVAVVKGTVDVLQNVFIKIIDFISLNGKLIIKWAIFLVIINLTFSILSFLLYSFYYGGAYILSHFVTKTTLNIIHMSFMSIVIYMIYKFLYQDN